MKAMDHALDFIVHSNRNLLSTGSLAVGGAAGYGIAKRMAITDLPQMVAAFHSLVGLAACTTAVANYMTEAGHMDGVHMTSTFLGALIGAITLTGGLTLWSHFWNQGLHCNALWHHTKNGPAS